MAIYILGVLYRKKVLPIFPNKSMVKDGFNCPGT